MHELSLVLSILDIVEEYDRQYDFHRVKSLRLSLGRLSCCEPRALTFAFEIQSRGTKAEEATLQFDISPVIIYCFSCEKEAELKVSELTCPFCGEGNVIMTGGTEELKLIEMDVE